MNVQFAINELKTLLMNEGISLYFGVSYDSRKQTANRTVHLMPFQIQADREGFCYYDADWTLRVLVRKEMNQKFRDNTSGMETNLIIEVANLASDVLRIINSSDHFLIIQKTNQIKYDYIPADMNASAATESMIRFQIPVRIWEAS